MTGQIKQLRLSFTENELGAPESVVAKFSSADLQARTIVHSMGFYEREVGFYSQFAADCPIRTPRCFFGAVEMDTGASILVLEDLTWMHNLNSTGGSLAEVELVIPEIGKLHAAWWDDARLTQTPWLPMKGIMTADQAPLLFRQCWQPFLDKLSIPITDEFLETGDLIACYLHPIWVWWQTEPPLTLVHNDVQGDNLLVTADERSEVAFIDWQLATGARAVIDLASFICSHLNTPERRHNEQRLLASYHSVLTENGVVGYSLEQCWDDYRIALLLPASRLATAVGLHPGLTATPGAFWNTAFPRYATAIADLGVRELLDQRHTQTFRP